MNCLTTDVAIDWSECDLVEVKPDVQRGRPVLRGTRMPVEDILENWEGGLDEPEIADYFELPLGQVRAVLAFAAAQQNAQRRDAPDPVR